MYSSRECLPLDSQACKYLTPQERAFKGSSELDIEVGSEAWYRPTIIIPDEPRTILQAQLFRQQFTYYTENIIAACLGLDADLDFSLEPIDSKTGLTLADPRLLTVINGRDLVQEFFQKLARYEIHLGRREQQLIAA